MSSEWVFVISAFLVTSLFGGGTDGCSSAISVELDVDLSSGLVANVFMSSAFSSNFA